MDNPKGPSIWSTVWGYLMRGLVETFQYGPIYGGYV